MTSKQIECFLSVAESLNFTQSSKKLYSSQSTVSRQISLLEEELGFDLFVRGNNFVRLTPAGATMFSTFSELCKTYTIQREIAINQNRGDSGSLRFGFYSNMHVENFLFNLIIDFHNQYPNINLIYECIPDGNIETAIKKEHLDLVFVHDFDDINEQEFVSNTVCSTNQFLLYGKAHPLSGKKDLSFEDFKDEIFWNVENRNSAKRQENMLKIFNYYNLNTWKSSNVSNFETILLNIRLGKGVIFIDPLTYMLDDEYYNVLALPETISEVGIKITWLKKNLNPAIALFTNKFFDCTK